MSSMNVRDLLSPYHVAVRSALAVQHSTRQTPNIHTTAAPVGRSNEYDTPMPAMLVRSPQTQPTIKRPGMLLASSTPRTAGTTRKENTNSTPAISVELVTITPRVA